MSGALLTYSRLGGRPPADHETLLVQADGSFTLWRSIAIASNPPAPVGWFAGDTDPEAVTTAAGPALADVSLPLPAGASTETLRVGGATLTGPNDGRVPDEWRGVTTLARALLGDLTATPVAALGLRTEPMALVHLGTDPLTVDLSRAVLRVVTWDGPAVTGASESALAIDATQVGPGWSVPLEVTGTGTVTVEVNGLRLSDGTDWHDASLSQQVELPAAD